MSATRLDTFSYTFTANGSSPIAGLPINGGCTIIVFGSTGGGTVNIDIGDGLGNFVQGPGSLAAQGFFNSAVWGAQFRLRLSGATAPSCTVTVVLNDNGQ